VQPSHLPAGSTRNRDTRGAPYPSVPYAVAAVHPPDIHAGPTQISASATRERCPEINRNPSAPSDPSATLWRTPRRGQAAGNTPLASRDNCHERCSSFSTIQGRENHTDPTHLGPFCTRPDPGEDDFILLGHRYLTQRPVPETSASPTVPVDVPTQRMVSESLTRWDSPPGRPPGRRLLIACGVSLAAGLALTGITAYTGAQALGARRTGHESMQLEATPENLTRNMSLEDEYRRLGPVAVVTGVAGGAAVAAAIVMLCVGARRKARAADSEPTLMPVRTGLLFTLKF
jgi:hypothetical protein